MKNTTFEWRSAERPFSETRGTIFFELNTPDEEVLRTIFLLPEKGSIRGVARATGHSKDTVFSIASCRTCNKSFDIGSFSKWS